MSLKLPVHKAALSTFSQEVYREWVQRSKISTINGIYITTEKIPSSSFCLLSLSQNPEVPQSFLFTAFVRRGFHSRNTHKGASKLGQGESGRLTQSPVKVIQILALVF